ncbi:MAG: lipoprotein [Gammaproteobacteria bacterium]|nr:lipoprotein [Gammaproteobacteria bacterium]
MRPTQPSSRSVRSGFLERRKALRLAAALPWAILVAGCGQKGPLYHPPEPEEEADEDNQTSAVPRVPGPRLG